MSAEFDLNLSNRPFPAYRAANIALAAILVVLIVVSAWQAHGFLRYSRRARSIRGTEQELRVDAAALQQQMSALESRLDTPESTAKLNEIGFLNHLILRRDFSWTRLFATLEEMVPDNVHLSNLTPNIGGDGSIILHLGVKAKTVADVTVFIKRLEQSPVFENVVVSAEEKKEPSLSSDVDITLAAVYYPQRDVR
ncbi:MAG TPA: PilN domain-containing protein [Terriglobia bacterium]